MNFDGANGFRFVTRLRAPAATGPTSSCTWPTWCPTTPPRPTPRAARRSSPTRAGSASRGVRRRRLRRRRLPGAARRRPARGHLPSRRTGTARSRPVRLTPTRSRPATPPGTPHRPSGARLRPAPRRPTAPGCRPPPGRRCAAGAARPGHQRLACTVLTEPAGAGSSCTRRPTGATSGSRHFVTTADRDAAYCRTVGSPASPARGVHHPRRRHPDLGTRRPVPRTAAAPG